MTKPSPTTDPRTVAGMKAAAEKLLPGDPAGQRDMIRNWFRGKAADADLNDEHTRTRVYAMAADLLPILGGTLPAMAALLTEREETR
jgi:hypothetical protein